MQMPRQAIGSDFSMEPQAEEALEYYRKGVEAAVRVLGPKGFKEYAGHF